MGARGVGAGREGQLGQASAGAAASIPAAPAREDLTIDLTVPGEVSIELVAPRVDATRPASHAHGGGVASAHLGAIPVVRRIPNGTPNGLLGATRLQLGLKRSIDIAVSSLALMLLAPVMALVAVLVKLSSPGPVLFRATRVGVDGETFEFWKFRSMYEGAERDRWSFEHRNEATGPVFKIPEDPRCTRVGRVLRRSSLDELPQLFHVLSGKMSLVGPRPPLPEEVVEYDDHARRRLAVRPGITCIWQTSGRSELSFENWVDMDIEYIENWTLGKDFQLMLRTIPAVLGGRGAY